jgi:exo-beta-1,3-glucanase (GH17 family)
VFATQGPAIAAEVQDPIEMEIKPDQSIIDFRGLAYGPFRGVGPDKTEIVTRSMIEEDMGILQEMGVNHIRTYGIGLGLNQVPFISNQYNITTATGTWVHTGNPDNFAEIDTALLAEDVSSMVIVGNEVLTGGVGFTEAELVGFIQYAQNERVNDSFPIATAEEWGFFAKNNSLTLEFERTALGNATDVIILHAHPVWHNIPLEDAAQWTIDRYYEVADLYPEKRVILGETGWPSESSPANPLFTPENQLTFFTDLMALIDADDIESYLFSAFDENWKGEIYAGTYNIGPFWGVIEEQRYGKSAGAYIATNYFGGSIGTTPPAPIAPTINSPADFQVDVSAAASISWTINDEDSADGTYSIYRNDVLQGVADLEWSSGSPITWSVDTSVEGVYTYKIVFTDDQELSGEDEVVVTVGDVASETSESSEESSENAETSEEESTNAVGFFVPFVAFALFRLRASGRKQN